MEDQTIQSESLGLRSLAGNSIVSSGLQDSVVSENQSLLFFEPGEMEMSHDYKPI